MEIYTFRTFSHAVTIAPDIAWCPTPDCPYAFIFDQRCTSFSCPMCSKSYCLSCKEKNHDGMSCAEFRVNFKHDPNDQLFKDFVKNQKYKQCPACQFWVEKNGGCNHMTCRCKHEF